MINFDAMFAWVSAGEAMIERAGDALTRKDNAAYDAVARELIAHYRSMPRMECWAFMSTALCTWMAAAKGGN